MHACPQKLLVGWLAPICLLFPGLAAAQARPVARLPVAPGLSQLVRSSGYIFAGMVSSIARVAPPGGNEVATVRITFRVEQALRGAQNGQTLTIHEWAGLWESGPRYRLGERFLLFLYPPSRLGLTSTVSGPMGRFSMDGKGQVILRQTQLDILRPFPVTLILRPGGTSVSGQDFARAVELAGRE